MHEIKNRIVRPRLGSKWLCIKNFPDDSDIIRYRRGEIYESESDGMITDDLGNEFYWRNNKYLMFNLFEYFELIPRNKRCTIKNLS